MLFEEQISRKPDLYPWTKEFIEAIWSGFWTPDEFNFRSDYAQFYSDLTEAEKGLIVRDLSAIAQIEVAVKSFWGDLGKTFPHPSIHDLGAAMANSEVIHNRAYEKLLDVLGLDEVFEQNLDEPALRGRVEYLKKYTEKNYSDQRKQFIYSIILFTLFVENVSLFSQFYVVLHLNKHGGYLKDTAQQVQYTRNEEMLHSEVGIALIQTLRREYPEMFDQELENRIVHECVESLKAEDNVIDWIIGDYDGTGTSLTADHLKTFIRRRMVTSLESIGFESGAAHIDIDPKLADETYWFDEGLYGYTMTDFFQKTPVDYAKGKGVDADELF